MQKDKKHHGKGFEDFLTGDYLKELDPKTGVEANAEIEKEEFLQFPDGVVQKAIGDRHSKGGIEVHIPDGTRIISNDLKFTKDQAKHLSEKFGTKITTKDTYAKGVEKSLSEIGYRKLEKEEVDLLKEIKRIEEDEKLDQNTAGINLEFLTGKLNEVVKKKQELEPKKKEIFDIVYNEQEAEKNMKGGYENTEGFKYGGVSQQNYKKLAQKYNITEEQLDNLINFKRGGEKLPKYVGGAEHNEPPAKPGPTRTLKENLSLVKANLDYDVPYSEAQKNSPQSRKRLNMLLANHGLPEIGEGESVDKAASRLQKKTLKEQPWLVEHYYKYNEKVSPTKLMKKIAKEAGIPDLTQETLVELEESNPTLYKRLIEEGTPDGLWWYRMPYEKELSVSRDQYTKIMADPDVANNLKEVNGEKYIVKPDGEYLKLIPTDEEEAAEDLTPDVIEKKARETEEIVFRDIPRVNAQRFQRFVHPAQYIPYLSSPEAHVMETPRRGRIGYSAVSANQPLEQIATTTGATQDLMKDLPTMQRAAFLSSTQANALGQEGKAITDVNRTDMENMTRANLFNIKQTDAENMMGIQALNRYDELMKGARATKEYNQHRAFDLASRGHAQNFYRDVDLNRYAAMTDNYELDMYGARPRYVQTGNGIQDYSRYIALQKAKGEDPFAKDKNKNS
jgi:hypothetical protein